MYGCLVKFNFCIMQLNMNKYAKLLITLDNRYTVIMFITVTPHIEALLKWFVKFHSKFELGLTLFSYEDKKHDEEQ